MARFVNPYTFVPQVPVPQREPPAGHAMMGDGRLSGVLKVTLTARTPLLIGGSGRRESDGEEYQDLPRRADGTVMVPGSGLMGAVRSGHEALAGGCLRVLDRDRVPVHRHPATTAETRDLRLAVVTRVDADGRAEQVALCDEWVWIPRELLPREEGRLPRTGDQLLYEGQAGPFPAGALTGVAARRVVTAKSQKHPKGLMPGSIVRAGQMGAVTSECWVLLVTDTNARDADRPVYFAAGRIGPSATSHGVRSRRGRPSRMSWPERMTCGPPVWPRPAKRNRALVRRSMKASGGRRRTREAWPRQQIAERLLARARLHPGQPVWVRLDEGAGQVTEIRLSQLWRYQGRGTFGERAGQAGPCTDPKRLCWSCRVFGSADTERRGVDDLAVQNSYRGHVRVDDLLAVGDVEPLYWHLAPLASPRPSAGQFYLDHTAVPAGKRVARKDTRPAAAWGSEADTPGLRPLRGRKFYWRTADPARGPRVTAGPGPGHSGAGTAMGCRRRSRSAFATPHAGRSADRCPPPVPLRRSRSWPRRMRPSRVRRRPPAGRPCRRTGGRSSAPGHRPARRPLAS